MAEKITNMNLQQLLEEIRKSEGLPENLDTEFQLWDEALKKEAFTMPEQILPLIGEIHGKHYGKGTSVRPLATEYSVERGDTGKVTSIRGDIMLLVGDSDVYHFEEEIEGDGSMVLRMFEYDVHYALSYPEWAASDSGRPQMALTFPHSAVLYLQDNRNTPDQLECRIIFPDGGIYTYRVPTLKVQSYSLEAIEERHLNILVPFLPLRFRKRMARDKETGKVSFQMQKEELTSFYRDIILMLDREVAGGQLTEGSRSVLLSLLRKAMIRVFHQDGALIREVVEMTEPILVLEIEEYIHAKEEAEERLRRANQEFGQKLEQANQEFGQKLEQANQEFSQKLGLANQEIALLRQELEQMKKQQAAVS